MIIFLLFVIALIVAWAVFPQAVGAIFSIGVISIVLMIWGWKALAVLGLVIMILMAAAAGDRAIARRRAEKETA